MNKPLGAQLSHLLKNRGVDVIFGIPGVHNQELYRGIEEAGITHVLARHEQGAGFMADGYARATGKPGVAYVITGPGLCNIMTPLGQAWSDSVPVLAISSCLDETAAEKGQLHQMRDQRAAAETVCDWSLEARSADAAYRLIDRAFTEFETTRPRPKHLQVPIAQLEALASPAPARQSQPVAANAGADAATVEQIAQALKTAQRPVAIFGGGAVGAAPVCAQVARRVGAAVFTTYAGRGIMPADDPLTYGSMLAFPDSVQVLQQADLLLVVGSELAQVDLWRDAVGHRCPMIRIDIDPSVLTPGHRAGDMQVLADAGGLMQAVDRALDGHVAQTEWQPQDVTTMRDQHRRSVEAERPGLVQICDALQQATPDGTMIYSDMTQLAYTALEVWQMDRPGHWHHPYGFGTLGYATPAAIGGAIGRAGKPTMAIIGDYGFHYTMQELGVAVELGLSLPIILWDNGKLKEIEDSMVRSQIAPNAVVARNPDFRKLADAFGAHAVAPGSLDELQTMVRAAFDAQGPTLIHVTPALCP